MIRKIILSGVILCLFIAIPLAVIGVKKVEPGVVFMNFMSSLSRHYETWKLDIPRIPELTPVKEATGWEIVLNFLMAIWNILVKFINLFVLLMNIIINVLQFICTFLFEIGYMIAWFIDNGDYTFNWYQIPVV